MSSAQAPREYHEISWVGGEGARALRGRSHRRGHWAGFTAMHSGVCQESTYPTGGLGAVVANSMRPKSGIWLTNSPSKCSASEYVAAVHLASPAVRTQGDDIVPCRRRGAVLATPRTGGELSLTRLSEASVSQGLRFRTGRSEIPLSRPFENRAQDRQRIAADVNEGIDAGLAQVRLPFGGLAREKERAGACGLERLGGICGLARIDRVR